MKAEENIHQHDSNCITQDALIKYIQGKLSDGDTAQVECHIADCPMCSDELDGLRLLDNPSDVKRIAARINKKIDRHLDEQKKIINLNFMIRVAAILAVFVGISTLVYYFIESSRPSIELSESIETRASHEEMTSLKDKVAVETVAEKHPELAKPETSKKEQQSEIAVAIVDDNVDVFAEFDVADELNPIDTALPVTQQSEIAIAQPAAAPVSADQVATTENAMAVGGMALSQRKSSSAKAKTEVDSDGTQKTSQITLVFAEEEEMEEDVVYMMVEQMPEFTDENGDDFSGYILKNRRYPPEAIEKSIQGKVYVEFCVEVDGSVTNVKVVRGVDPLLDKEAVRLVESSPKWKPGTQRGKPVKVRMAFTVSFEIH